MSVNTEEELESNLHLKTSHAPIPLAVRVAAYIVGVWRPISGDCPVHQSSFQETDDLLNDANRLGILHQGRIGMEERLDENSNREAASSESTRYLCRGFSAESTYSRSTQCTCRSGVLKVPGYLVCSLIFIGHLTDIIYRWYLFWGNQTYIMILVAYDCFIIQIFMVSAFCFLARFYSDFVQPRKESSRIDNIIGDCSIYDRVSVLSCTNSRLRNVLKVQTLALFLILPIVDGILRITTSLKMFHPQCHANFIFFTDWMAAIGFILYGFFWYVVYLYRVSLQCQVELTLRILGHFSERDRRDRSRHHIRTVFTKYFSFHELIGYWMAITMITVSWGIMTRFTWDYGVKNGPRENYIYFAAMVWLQYVTFIVTPIIALGGLNLDYVWKEFYHAVVKSKTEQFKEFWEEMRHLVRWIDSLGRPELKWTLLFSFIGLYMAFRTDHPKESLEFWGLNFLCNSTSTTTEPRTLN